MTTLCNVRVKHLRPTYNNLKEWCEDEHNVYIGRGRIVFINGERYPKEDSMWANPYKGVGAIEKYRIYMNKKLEDHYYKDELLKLRGKNLGCWCHPQDCHGNVLIELLKI